MDGVHAVLDVGTNSVKLLVGEKLDGRLHARLELVEITRLGEGLTASGHLDPAAMQRTLETIGRFCDQARELGAQHPVVVGTMAMREAANRDAFRDDLRNARGIELEVIDGKEEARLSYRAARIALDLSGRVCVFDIGGGSTELIYGEGDTIVERFSLNVGVRRLTEQYLHSDPTTENEMAALRSSLDDELAPVHDGASALIGIGGTATTIAAVKHSLIEYDADAVHGSVLPRSELERQIQLYASLTHSRRQNITGLPAQRADVILAGACIVAALMEKVGVDELRISDRGLRHGVFYDRFIDRVGP